MTRSTVLQRKWALAGAAARMMELQEELDAIFQVFPELRDRAGAIGGTRGATAPRRRKRRFSSEAKRRMSEGMRKYWARRRAQAAKAGTAKTTRAAD